MKKILEIGRKQRLAEKKKIERLQKKKKKLLEIIDVKKNPR